MAIEEVDGGVEERLDGFIKLAQTGQTIQLQINVYRNIVKQTSQSESTDDIDIATDMCLLMADFAPTADAPAKPAKVTKVYAICPINEIEVNEKITRHIANERLRMDYARLKEGKVKFEELYF
jgi:hypothetical protein